MTQGSVSNIADSGKTGKGKKKKAVLVTVIVLFAAVLVVGTILVSLLMQDNVTHKYSATPNLDALTEAMVELGANSELTLTPQEMTDTVGYFLKNGTLQDKIAYKEIYFDVAEDGENALIVVPIDYKGTRLVLQLTVAMGLREVTEEERYYTLTVVKTKIGELVIPPRLVNSHLKKMKFTDFARYEEGEILIDSSFFSLDIFGARKTFKVLELSVVPEGFYIRTESLSDFLIGILSENFKGILEGSK